MGDGKLKSWLRDESGQSTTEYVLLVLILVIAVKQVGNTFKTQLGKLVGQVFDQAGQAATEVGRE